jgi:hypothetical protein
MAVAYLLIDKEGPELRANCFGMLADRYPCILGA